ncbi:hypothetical protein ACFPJ4_14670 [Lysinimonas soli]|uniref:SCP domain-containing protein n=1 Tax=Lysinimonas soli TaxID=1074233 RepID=A0ABW0NTS2_9MICO
MKRTVVLGTVFATVFVLALPFVGGGGPSFLTPALASEASFAGLPVAATSPIASGAVTQVNAAQAVSAVSVPTATVVSVIQPTAALTTDSEHVAQKPVPKPVVVAPPTSGRKGGDGGVATRRAQRQAAGQACPAQGSGGGSAPGVADSLGQGMITGTTTADIQSFSSTFNAIRAQNCLDAIPAGNFRYDSCMEQRLFWMAEDPSTDPSSAWGHMGSVRSDGVPSRGCDGNLAGGSGNTGATVATKWWNSLEHRLSLYRPSYSGSTAGVCIYFAMSHGGIPNEPSSFTRAAARWGGC